MTKKTTTTVIEEMGPLESEAVPINEKWRVTKAEWSEVNATANKAHYGSLECYKKALDLSGKRKVEAGDVYEACVGGQWKTLQWMMDIYDAGDVRKHTSKILFRVCMVRACESGHMDMVDWLMICGREKAGIVGNKCMVPSFVKACRRYGHADLENHLVTRWECPVPAWVCDCKQ